MLYKDNKFQSGAIIFLFSIFLLFLDQPAESQIAPALSYEAEAEAPTENENYRESRKSATNRAMRRTVQEALQDLLGDPAYAANQGALTQILSRSHRYVRSYNYLESQDDVENKVSRVKIEVTLYIDALRRRLARLGVLSAKSGKRSVVILIIEKSFTSREESSLWDYTPIAEVALGQKFIEDGIHAINRGSIVDLISEETISRAARGDISAAVDIGLQTGAEVVVVGNAVSSILGGPSSSTLKNIQANLSLKVVSTNRGSVIAAKSDFVSVKTSQELKGELQAFELVSEKLSGFLVGAVQRFWNPTARVKSAPKPDEAPQPLTGAMDEL
ncbi:MAG: hypothetical protein ACQ9MH_06085 [Nitrospinales bacterium]